MYILNTENRSKKSRIFGKQFIKTWQKQIILKKEKIKFYQNNRTKYGV